MALGDEMDLINNLARSAQRSPIATIASAAVLSAVLITPGSAPARSLFLSNITVGSETERERTNKITNVTDFYKGSNLGDEFPGYVGNEAVTADLDLRGLMTKIGYLAGDPCLFFQVEAVGLNERFCGATRDESAEMFEEWLQGNLEGYADSTVTDLLQALVAESPVDPVAGNPNSLQSKMMLADWQMGTMGPLMQQADENTGWSGLFSIGATVGHYEGCSDGCMDVTSLDVPLRYAFNLKRRRLSLLVDLPLAITWTENQESVIASLGLGAQAHVFPWWSFTGTARFGGAGSVDVGAVAIMYSFAAVNRMSWDVAGFTLGMGNLFAVSKTFEGVEIKGFDLTYDLRNEVLRNGLDISGDAFELLNRPIRWEIFGSYTNFFGSDLFLENYGEVGGALALSGDIGGAEYDTLRLGVSYLRGDGYDGFHLSVDFRF